MAPYPKNCWPTTEQTLLLRSVLLQNEDAVTAWEQWKHTVEFNDIDYGSQRLIPLLYTKLIEFGIEDPLMAYYKGLYRNFWVKSQLQFAVTSAVLQNLNGAGIETLLHKGAGIILGCDLKMPLRPMDDIDFIVHKVDAKRAITIIREMDWRTKGSYPEDLDLIHAYSFQNGRGQNIDLHWHSLDIDLTDLHITGYWERSFKAKLGDVPVSVMGITDQLIHTCVHGIRWSRIPPIRWVVDAVMLIENPKRGVDWSHLVDHTEKLSVSNPMFQGLNYLKTEFDVQIPDDVLDAVEQIPVTRFQKWEFWLSQQNRHPIFGLMTYNKKIIDYIRFHREKYRFPGYLRYLQHMWGIKSLWQVPFIGVSHVWENIKTVLSKQEQDIR